jgi:hypothetical protein
VAAGDGEGCLEGIGEGAAALGLGLGTEERLLGSVDEKRLTK